MGALSMDEFLGHSVRGSRGQVMKSWTKKGKVLVWLNRNSAIHCVWRHSFKRIVTLKDKAPEIWGEKFRCFEEDEDVLRNQNRRQDGVRVYPPTCGYCRFLEDIRNAIIAKDVSWVDPVFKFEAGGKIETMHAGGLIGFFKSDKLTDEEKAEMASVNVYTKTAWKEESRSKPEYLFCVVDDADPKSGNQVTIETQAIGDKMKRAIGDQMKARREKGDPLKNPYPFLWEYSEGASFDDAYNVVAMIEDVPSAEVRRLIDSAGPDVSSITRLTPAAQVRAMLEQNDVMGIDWKGYFPDEPAAKKESTPEVRGESIPDEELVACDDCGKAMKPTDTKCASCGKVYEVESASKDKIPPPPPPKKAEPAPTEAPKPQVTTSNAFAGGDGDIPF